MEHFFEGVVTLEALHRLPPDRPDLLRIALLFGKHDNLIAGVPRVVQRAVYAIARSLAWVTGAVVPSWSEVAHRAQSVTRRGDEARLASSPSNV
jgi:hypothetical protein